MNTKPDALKLASVPIFDRSIGWQADATATLKEQASEIERLRAELAAEKKWGELWYFVSDEEPLAFEKIVSEWTPSRWIDQAYKLMAAKRGA